MARVSIMGSGGWGTALAIHTAGCGHEVCLWSAFEEEINALKATREHTKLLPGVKIPDSVELTTDIRCAADAQLVISAVPSFAVRQTAKKLAAVLPEKSIVVNVAKGFEEESLLRLSEVLEQELPMSRIVAFSGPSHAEEVALGIPTTVVSASLWEEAACFVQDALMNSSLRVYVHPDVVGVELGGALKNIIALAAGICDGLGMGDNTKAALMTRGLSEIARLGVAMGARKETFAGLTGVGDLIVTCTSMHSRNRRAGILIGQGVSPEEAVRQIGMVEGYLAAASANRLAEKYHVDMPITQECCRVLYEGKQARAAVEDLMKRPRRSEEETTWLDFYQPDSIKL